MASPAPIPATRANNREPHLLTTSKQPPNERHHHNIPRGPSAPTSPTMAAYHDRSFSLQNLDPSPVDDDTDNTFPQSVQTSGSVSPHSPPHTKGGISSTHHGLALGLSGHSPIWYLAKIQKYSAYAFSAFGVAHLVNTAIIPLVTQSVPNSESFLLLTRPYYQGLPFEPLLVAGPLALHITSGLALRVSRRNLNAKRYGDYGYGDDDTESSTSSLRAFFSSNFWPAVSRTSALGFALTPLLAGHIYLNRFVPSTFPGGSSNINLSYVSHAFARHTWLSYASFLALITTASAHMVWGWARYTAWTPAQATGEQRVLHRKRRWYLLNGLVVLLSGLWIGGGVGVVGRGGAAAGWVGRQYDEMMKSVPLIGRWL